MLKTCTGKDDGTCDELFVRAFYVNRINHIAGPTGPDSIKEAVRNAKTYLTDTYYDQLSKAVDAEDLTGADPFLRAQDFDASWSKQMRIFRAIVNPDGRTYLVCFGQIGTMRHAVLVRLVTGPVGPQIDTIAEGSLESCPW
jgi:hypothetical protein